MPINNTSVDSYLAEGCGRCEHFQTPQCKVHLWTAPLIALRELLRESELVEEMKWGSPCYTLGGKNVVMIASFREWCGLSFLKGVLMQDDEGLLELPGPNTQAARVLKFTDLDQVQARKEQIRDFIQQAIALEKAGAQPVFERSTVDMPEELQEVLDSDPEVARAFAALTPGRQRSHVIHVSGAKAARTRVSRAEKCIPKILDGKGFLDR